MRHIYSLLLAYFLSLISYHCIGQQLYSIPKQTIDPFKILGKPSPNENDPAWMQANTPRSMKLDMNEFEISNLITFAEYKQYLRIIKMDSSEKYYLSQLPDTSMCLPENYKEYVSGNQYDDYPVMGISWDAAMNYCRWRTKLFNQDSIKYIYRLPCESEWLDAYHYLDSLSVKNDFSKDYSDWLLNSYDANHFDFIPADYSMHGNKFDYIYLASKKEPNVLKRKCAIGDSYLFKLQTLFDYNEISYESYQGYRQVGFRFLKEKVDTINLINKFGKPEPSMDIKILKNWGLKN